MANVAITTAVASTALAAYSAYSSAKARSAEAKYQAQVADNNKKVAEWKAGDAIHRGRIAENQHRLKVANLKGRQRSVLASSGTDANEDDAIDILADTAEIGELDSQTIRSNAQREAFGHRVAASNQGAQSSLLNMKAANQNPLLDTGSALFGGASSVASKWYAIGSGA